MRSPPGARGSRNPSYFHVAALAHVVSWHIAAHKEVSHSHMIAHRPTKYVLQLTPVLAVTV